MKAAACSIQVRQTGATDGCHARNRKQTSPKVRNLFINLCHVCFYCRSTIVRFAYFVSSSYKFCVCNLLATADFYASTSCRGKRRNNQPTAMTNHPRRRCTAAGLAERFDIYDARPIVHAVYTRRDRCHLRVALCRRGVASVATSALSRPRGKTTTGRRRSRFVRSSVVRRRR